MEKSEDLVFFLFHCSHLTIFRSRSRSEEREKKTLQSLEMCFLKVELECHVFRTLSKTVRRECNSQTRTSSAYLAYILKAAQLNGKKELCVKGPYIRLQMYML